MSEENVEIVRRHLAPYEGQDIVPAFREMVEQLGPTPESDAVLALWAEDPAWSHVHRDVVWETFGGGPLDAKMAGPAEVGRWWATDWANAWEAYTYRVVEYRDLGEWVLTRVEVRATGRGGIPVDMRTFEIRKVRDGKIAVIKVFALEADALEAAGLSE
jgi:ketosteroid isomerase-like protein